MDWQTEALQRFETARGIAHALLEQNPKLKKRWPNVHNNVAKLLAGDVRWWRDTGREALDALAKLVGRTPEDLLATSSPADGLPFPEFPDLSPLRRDERPFEAHPGTSLVALAAIGTQHPGLFGGGERRWIVAPPGSGKSLVVRYLGQVAPESVVAASVPTLEHALERLGGSATGAVFEVDRSTTRDAELCEKIRDATRACTVLAPFEIPGSSVRSGGSRALHSKLGWEMIEATPFALWRPEFIEWVCRRRAASRPTRTWLDAAAMNEWLALHDPSSAIVRTPGDALALCADVDRHGTGGSLDERARRWLETVGVAQLDNALPASYRERLGARVFASLVGANFRGIDRALGEASVPVWEALVPDNLAPRAKGAQPGGPVIVAAMLQAGLLRHAARGVEPYPRWVAQGIVEKELTVDFDAKAGVPWGIHAVDGSRSAAVDGALDHLSSGAFRGVLKRTLDHFDASSLESVAAIEALFAAAARRAHRGERPRAEDEERWRALASRQLEIIRGTDDHAPITRRDREELIANGWNVSLAFGHGPQVDGADGWLLPGWARSLELDTLPDRFPPCVREDVDPTPFDPSGRICELAPKIIGKVRVASLGSSSVPRTLLPALFLDTARPWNLRREHLDALGRHTWELATLIHQGRELADDRRQALADRVWCVATAEHGLCVVERIELLDSIDRELAKLVLASVTPGVVAETVRRDGLHIRGISANSLIERSPEVLRRLGPAVLAAALQAWNERAPVLHAKWIEAIGLAPLLGRDDFDVALDLARTADDETGGQFARVLWSLHPSTAKEEATRAIDDSSQGAARWFWQAPREQLPFLASLLDTSPTIPVWASRWAYVRMLEAGAAAPVMFRLMRRSAVAQPDPDA